MDKVRKYIGYDKVNIPCQKNDMSICILDSGIFPHKDFDQRILLYKDFVDGKQSLTDEYGHGTHIAGICAGNGSLSNGKYQGVSPQSNLIIGKILDSNGTGKLDYLIQGVAWCLENQRKYNIRILNISVGLMQQLNVKKQTELMDMISEAWNRGIVTLCAAGNNGPKAGSVTIPGTHPKVITVGSVDVKFDTGYPSIYSGRGPTADCILKPEIYAPGSEIVSCGTRRSYTKKTGTSMSVPVVSGCVALLLQKRGELEPVDVKLRLYEKSKKVVSQGLVGWGAVYLPYLLSN